MEPVKTAWLRKDMDRIAHCKLIVKDVLPPHGGVAASSDYTQVHTDLALNYAMLTAVVSH
eukprot:scaffold69652_cov51-Prasinocladus_malaysianus.AAC.1